MTIVHVEGSNFRIEVEGDAVVCRVWSRPDVSFEEGAKSAQQMDSSLRALVVTGKAKSLLFDISEAPPVVGPVTEGALGALFGAWEKSQRPVAILGRDHAMMKLQFKRIVATHAKEHGAFFEDATSARTWLTDRTPR